MWNRHQRIGIALAAVLFISACGPGTQPSASGGGAATSAPAAPSTSAPAAAQPSTAPAAASPATAKPAVSGSPSPAAAAAPPSPAAAAAGASPSAVASPAVAAPSVTGPVAGEAKTLNGGGSTFAAPLYQKWFDIYAGLTGVQINYQAIGSGGGIQGIQNQTLDFGATDAPMSDDQLAGAKGGPIFHIPTALGAIVPTYNIPNVNGKLKFTGDTLAGIYLGDIQKWNDPKLVADNPDLANVDQDIVVVHRSDGSGTTFGFSDYLSAVSPEWLQKVGKGTSVDWPVGLGGNGNPGVAGEVQQNPYSIGYVELIYALQNNLGYGTVKNKSGKFIDPSLDSVTAAAAASAQNIPPDLRFSIVDAPGENSYSISTATWLLVYKNETDQAKALAITRMLWWATHDAQQYNKDLQYATVPDAITRVSEQFIKQINVGGTPVLPAQ
jgi:phosphate transport system substrate-binding protein